MKQDSTIQRQAIDEAVSQVVTVVLAEEPTVQIFLFGSRAMGTHVKTSDFDIGLDLGHPMDPVTMNRVREIFDAVNIMQKIDVVDFQAAAAGFLAIAKQHMEILYER